MIDEIITGTATSSTTTPTSTVSEFYIDTDSEEDVVLEMQLPSGDWVPIYTDSGAKAI